MTKSVQIDGILPASSSKFCTRQLVIKNQSGDLTQSETAKYFPLFLIGSSPTTYTGCNQNGEQRAGNEHGKRENGKEMETKQGIGNKVTDRARVQVTYYSHFFIFPSFLVLVSRSPLAVLVTPIIKPLLLCHSACQWLLSL